MNRRTFLRMTAWTAGLHLAGWRYAGARGSRAKPGQYDAVIVGAGLGGLACGAYLAKNGFKPLVVEQHSVPGGYATSFTRLAGGKQFTCEVSLHASSFASPSSRLLLEELGLWDRLSFVEHRHAWVSRFPDLALDVPAKAGLAGFEALLRDRFPGQARGLSEHFALWRGVMAEMAALDKGLSQSQKLAFALKFKTLWDIRDKTIGEVVDRSISDPQLKAVLCQSCGYYGLPPGRLSAFYYLYPTGQYLEYGGQYLKGSSQALSDALAAVITSGGGELLTDTRVEAILLERGRAVGVRVAGGREYRGEAVVCNAAAPQVFGQLLPESAIPEKDRAALSGLEPSLGSFIVWLGLGEDVTGRFSLSEASFYPGTDQEAAYQANLNGDLERSGFSVMLYDNLVPGFSPPGRSTMTIMTLCGYEPWKRFEADYLTGRKEAYRAEKERLTKLLIRRAQDSGFPGLEKLIVMADSATPLTNLRFTGNTGGAIYGYDQTPSNSFLSRLPNKTGIPGLYLAGAWGSPGGGFGGALMGGKKVFKDLAESWG